MRVLIVDDLVLRAEVLALGLSAYPDIVVVGRLRLSDNHLGPRSSAAPADVALVSLPPGPETGRVERGPAGEDVAPAVPRWLTELTDDLRRNRPELSLIALVDPRETAFVEMLERQGIWLCMETTRSLEELVEFLRDAVGHVTD